MLVTSSGCAGSCLIRMFNDRKRDLRIVIEDVFDNDVTLAGDLHGSDCLLGNDESVSKAAHTPKAMKSA